MERHITRTAGDAIWESNLGNEKGRHYAAFYRAVGPDSTPEFIQKAMVPRDVDAGIRNKLIYDGWSWYLEHAERPLNGTAVPADDPGARVPGSLQSIGLSPYAGNTLDTNPLRLLAADYAGFDKAVFRERHEGMFPTVSAEWGNGRRVEWKFDDRRGGMPVQASLYRSDDLVSWSETDYEKLGERWFPKSVRFFRADSDKPYKMIEVQRATFDEPWHMQELTPSEIGALSGTQFLGPGGVNWWSGAQLIPHEEFLELAQLDDSILDQRIVEMLVERTGQTPEQYRAAMRRAGEALRKELRAKYGADFAPPKKRAEEKDEWDVYVEDFIRKLQLPDPLVKRAHETRDSAKRLRDVHRLRSGPELRKAERKGDKRRMEDIENEEKRIFERMLVRPLKKLIPKEKK